MSSTAVAFCARSRHFLCFALRAVHTFAPCARNALPSLLLPRVKESGVCATPLLVVLLVS